MSECEYTHIQERRKMINLLKALADETRLRLVAILLEGPL